MKCAYHYYMMQVLPELSGMTRLFKALGDETRLRIVALLVHGELCVCHIQEALGLSQPNISRHLAILRSAGVVETRRAGIWMYYRLAEGADAEYRRHLDALRDRFLSHDTIAQDVKRLLQTKGPTACC